LAPYGRAKGFKAAGDVSLFRVKLRKPRYEQMFSAVPPIANIAGCDRGTRSRIIEKDTATRKMTGYGSKKGRVVARDHEVVIA
jgi:hypothetical protein